MVTADTKLELQTVTVAEIALRFPRSIDALNRYNLDFCCQGKRLFVEACREGDLVPEAIWSEIMEKEFICGVGQTPGFTTWDAASLIDHITQHHHHYVRAAIPHIQELLAKVCSVHAVDQPQLLDIRDLFSQLADELLAHLVKEEAVLFPAIRRAAERNKRIGVSTLLSDLQMPVLAMEHEHESAGDLLKLLRSLTTNYTPPLHACPTFQLTYRLLKEFDSDLTQHIHLENNVLFPMAKEVH